MIMVSKSIGKKILKFFHQLSGEFQSLNAAEIHETERKKEKTCCEVSETLKRKQLL